MKYIVFVAPQDLANPVDGARMGKATSQLDVMLTLTSMEGFAASKSGVEQMELILAIRTSLRNQAAEAAHCGYWALEDTHADEVHKAATNVRWNPASIEAALPHMRAIRDMKSEKPGAAARPIAEAAPNGAAQA